MPRGVVQEQALHLWHPAHLDSQQVRNAALVCGRRRAARIEQFGLPQDQVDRLQRTGRLLGQRVCHVVVLALGHIQHDGPVVNRVQQGRQPDGAADRHHNQNERRPQPDAGPARPIGGN